MAYERDWEKFQWTLDNAVLAAADPMHELPPSEVVSAYLAAQNLTVYEDDVIADDLYLDRTVSAPMDLDYSTHFM